MKNQIIILGALSALSACSWVDETGSQQSNLGIQSDASTAQLVERAEYEVKLSDDVVQANFVTLAEGSAAAGNCGDYLLPADSATSLASACDVRLDDGECDELAFRSVGNDTYAAKLPTLQQSVALRIGIKAEDINGVIVEDEQTLCIKAVNDAPVAVAHDYQVEYLGTLTTQDAVFGQENDADDFSCYYRSGSGVLQGSSDDYDFASVNLSSEYPCLSAAVVTPPSHATSFSLNPLGGFSYQPAASLGPGSSDTFSYVVNDGTLNSDPQQVTITVIGENDPPEILSIGPMYVDENSTGSIAVTSLARDPEGETMNIAAVGTPANGSANQSEDGTQISYSPNQDYVGNDSFDFTVEDIAGAQASGQISVIVAQTNEAPSISAPNGQDFYFNNAAAYPVSFNATVSDREDDSNLLRLSASSSRTDIATVSAPAGISSDGRATISINPVANGSTMLTLTVTDRGLNGAVQRPAKSATASVLVTINNINRAPSARDTSREVQQGGTLSVNLADLSSDPDGNSLSYSLISPPTGVTVSGSTLSVSAAATATARTFSVTYEVSDGFATDRGTVSITVSARPNNAPTANNASRTVAPGESATFDLNTLSNDADGDPLTFNLISPPAGATRNNNIVTVATSAANAGSSISVRYSASDGEDTATGTLTVNVGSLPNSAPVAGNANREVQQGGTTTVNLADLASDADDDSLSFNLVSPPNGVTISGSTLTVGAAATTTARTFSVTYEVSDGEASDRGTVSITVTALPNNAPVARDASRTVDPGESATFELNTLSSDADGDALTFNLVNPPAGATLNNNIVTVTTSAANAGNTISVRYSVSDGEETTTGTLTVNVEALPNNAPVAGDDSKTVAPGSQTSFNLRSLSSDADGDELTFALAAAPASAVLGANGLVTVTTTNADADSTISFRYTASDGEATATGNLEVNVLALPNNAPVAGDSQQAVTAGDDATFNLNNLASDADGDTLEFALLGAATNATLSNAGVVTVTTSLADAGGAISVRYSADDGEDSDTGTLTVNVEAP